MTLRRLSLIALAACAAVAAGCGGSDGGGQGGGGQGAGDPATGPGPPVVMRNIEFVPRSQTLKVGQTVKWVNEDPVAHTVTKASGPGPAFDSGTVPPNGRYAKKFDVPGEINYVCTIHPNHKGSLTITR